MTLVATRAPMWWPRTPRGNGVPVLTAWGNLAAGTSKMAAVLKVPKTGTLHSFEWLCGTETDQASHVLRMSFQDPDASGDPDGSVDQYRTLSQVAHGGVWVIPAGPLTSDGTDTGTKRSVTAGQDLACVVDFSSYTSGTASWNSRAGETYFAMPYADGYAGSWNRALDRMYGMVALKYDDGTYGVGADFDGPTSITTDTFNVDSVSFDELAMKFNIGADVEVDAVCVYGDFDGTYEAVIYNSAGTAVATSVSMPAANRMLATGRPSLIPIVPVTLLSGDYFLAVKPTTTTDVSVYSFLYDTNGMMAGVPGGTATGFKATRVGAGVWTVSTTEKPLFAVRISKIDDLA